MYSVSVDAKSAFSPHDDGDDEETNGEQPSVTTQSLYYSRTFAMLAMSSRSSLVVIILTTLLVSSNSFAPPQTQTNQRSFDETLLPLLVPASRLQQKASCCTERSLILSMSSNGNNEDNDSSQGQLRSEPDGSKSPQETLQKAADDFFSSAVYRTLLFTIPFLFNANLRAMIPNPLIFVTVAAILAFNTYDMRSSEIKELFIPKRNTALQFLKKARADRLSNPDGGGMDQALQDFEEALRRECQARVIVPALWVIPFTDTDSRQAAKSYLELEITDNCELIPLSERKDSQ